MTFDDGILAICDVINAAPPGKKPVYALKEKAAYYYGYEKLGVTRYYQAKQADQQVECVVAVPGWEDIKTTDICVLEGGVQYKIAMVQPGKDDNGLRMTELSLERIDQSYEVPGKTSENH